VARISDTVPKVTPTTVPYVGRVTDVTRITDINRITDISRITDVTRITDVSRVFSYEQFVPGIVPPLIPLISGGGGPGFGRGFSFGYRRSTSYQPSLRGIVFNIRSKRMPKGLSGIEVRPIVGGRSKGVSMNRIMRGIAS
jgi:hypothetical protein